MTRSDPARLDEPESVPVVEGGAAVVQDATTDPGAETEPNRPTEPEPETQLDPGTAEDQVGNDNIREGRVGGVLGGPRQQQGQGQG
jgi:hypothetical protein